MTPIHSDRFYHDGRGPELKQIHWTFGGRQLVALDYTTPGDVDALGTPNHVKFYGFQVVMITPEEVVNYDALDLGQRLFDNRPAALFDMGRTGWLNSFSPTHLSECKHYQLLFYDELFDVIAENVNCFPGHYDTGTAV